MEDEWNVINSIQSSQKSEKSRPFRPSVELDFNRFESMPQFQLDEDSLSSYSFDDKESSQLLEEEMSVEDQLDDMEEEIYREESTVEEGEAWETQAEVSTKEEYSDDISDNALCENETIGSDHHELVIDLSVKQPSEEEEDERVGSLLDSKLMNDDTKTVKDPISYFTSMIQDKEEQTTRESLVDKSTIWRNLNSISGSSVPYMSNIPIHHHEDAQAIFKQKPFLYPFFRHSAQLPFSPTSTEKAAMDPMPSMYTPETNMPKKRLLLTTHRLPPFAATPRQTTLSTTRTAMYDIQPVETTSEEQKRPSSDTAMILKSISDCFTFASEDSQVDTLFYHLKSIQPIEEWYRLTKLDLSHQHLTSINNLCDTFPFLEYLQISHNQLKVLDKLPSTLIYLHASDNNLKEIDISHLNQLQILDISYNQIHHLDDMSELKCLLTLDASHNSITSCKPFQNLSTLNKLSLKANCIRRLVNFESMIAGNQLEILDVSYNRIESLDSIENLTNLCYLNAEHNNMRYVKLNRPMERIYKLQLSFNGLKSIDLSQFPGIRTLYLDDNTIHHLIGMNCITRIESFSLRDQRGNQIEYNLQHLRGARKLYLSGSPFYNINRLIDFFSLEYLELCAAHIDHLPADFAKQVPNLSTLYLSFNRLSNIQPLRKLKYLVRLVLMDNRLIHLNEVVAVVKNLKRLRYLDLRQNPMSVNIYPPIHMKQFYADDRVSPYVASALDRTWPALDNEFFSSLSLQWLAQRNKHRAALIQACPKLIELDHIQVQQNERPDIIQQDTFKRFYTL